MLHKSNECGITSGVPSRLVLCVSPKACIAVGVMRNFSGPLSAARQTFARCAVVHPETLCLLACCVVGVYFVILGLICGKPDQYCLYLDVCSLDFAHCHTAAGGVWDIWKGTTLVCCSVGLWATGIFEDLARYTAWAKRSRSAPCTTGCLRQACVAAGRPVVPMALSALSLVLCSYYLASLSLLHPGVAAAKSASVVAALACGAVAAACSWGAGRQLSAGKRSLHGGAITHALPLDGDFYAKPSAFTAAAGGHETGKAQDSKAAAVSSVVYVAATVLLWLASLGPRSVVGLFIFGPPEESTNSHLCSFAPHSPQGSNVSCPGQSGPTSHNSYRPHRFDRSRCSHDAAGFKVFVYPREPQTTSALMASSLSSGSCPDKHRLEVLLSVWSESKFATKDASDACILVPNLPVDGMCKHGIFQYRLTAAFRDLAHWNYGRNHVLAAQFDDDDCPQMEADYAAHLRSTFSAKCYRPAYDHTALLVHQVPKKLNPSTLANSIPFSKRRWLSSFVGRCSTDSEHTRHALQLALGDRADGDDEWDSFVSCIDIPSKNKVQHNFADVLRHSKFAFAPRGHGFHSFRLLEAMQSGAVPVMIGDTGTVPFDGCVDWRQLSLHIRQSDIMHSRSILASISDEHGDQLQANVKQFVSVVAQTWDDTAMFTLECIRRKIYGPSVWKELGESAGMQLAWLV